MKLVGLTGSIGTGKTSISNILKQRGVEIIDADEISRKISNTGNEGYCEVVRIFGKEVLDHSGGIDRKKLGGIVFSDGEKLQKLNEALHPIIIRKINEKIESIENRGIKLAVIDAPLLIETGLHEIVDVVLLVVCSEEVQICRIQKRDGLTRKQAIERIKSQMSQCEKKKYADYIIDNSRDMESLKREVDKFLESMEDAEI